MLGDGLVFDLILWLMGQSKEGHYNKRLELQTSPAPKGAQHLLRNTLGKLKQQVELSKSVSGADYLTKITLVQA